MPELELVKSLLQAGAAGILCLAGWYMMRFLREERADRSEERQHWFTQMDSLTTKISQALDELRESHQMRCPFYGVDRHTVELFERRLRDQLLREDK